MLKDSKIGHCNTPRVMFFIVFHFCFYCIEKEQIILLLKTLILSGLGVITTEDIPENEYITKYTGTYIKDDPGPDNDDYVYELTQGRKRCW